MASLKIEHLQALDIVIETLTTLPDTLPYCVVEGAIYDAQLLQEVKEFIFDYVDEE